MPKGTAYVKIYAIKYYYNVDTEPVDCIYHLTVTVTPVNGVDDNADNPDISNKELEKKITSSRVVISTVSSKKQSVSLRWKIQFTRAHMDLQAAYKEYTLLCIIVNNTIKRFEM